MFNAAPASLARRRRRAQAANAKTNWGSLALRGAGALGPWGTDGCVLRIDICRRLSRDQSQNLVCLYKLASIIELHNRGRIHCCAGRTRLGAAA